MVTVRILVTALKIMVVAGVISLLGDLPTALAQQGPQPPPPFKEMYRMPVVYSVPDMNKVQIHHDLVYKTIDVKNGKFGLKLDAYIPPETKQGNAYPAVVLISGGAIEGTPYDFRDADIYVSYGRMLAASGFVGISFNKRYERGPAGTLAGNEDVRDLVIYLRKHAAELSINKNRIAFWAFSAGGFLLAPVLAESPSYASAVLCFYCVSDIDQDTWSGVPGITDEMRARTQSQFSSAGVISKGGHPFPPLLIGRAGWDSPGLNRGIDRLIQEALAKDVSIEVLNHPTGRHGFDIIDSNARSREIIQRALEFLKTNLAPD
jgi:acetyl esterase/lipase